MFKTLCCIGIVLMLMTEVSHGQCSDPELTSDETVNIDVQIQSTGKSLAIQSNAVSRIVDPRLILVGLLDERVVKLEQLGQPLRVKDIYYSVFVSDHRKRFKREDFPLFLNVDDAATRDRLIAKLLVRLIIGPHLVKDQQSNWTVNELSRFHLAINAALKSHGLVARYMGPLATNLEEDRQHLYSWSITTNQVDGQTICRIRLLGHNAQVEETKNRIVLTTKKKRLIIIEQFKRNSDEFRNVTKGKGRLGWLSQVLNDITEAY